MSSSDEDSCFLSKEKSCSSDEDSCDSSDGEHSCWAAGCNGGSGCIACYKPFTGFKFEKGFKTYYIKNKIKLIKIDKKWYCISCGRPRYSKYEEEDEKMDADIDLDDLLYVNHCNDFECYVNIGNLYMSIYSKIDLEKTEYYKLNEEEILKNEELLATYLTNLEEWFYKLSPILKLFKK